MKKKNPIKKLIMGIKYIFVKYRITGDNPQSIF